MDARNNRLINEKSPYLLQHAHNPVDWYPWGPEAFSRARRERKPILLSIGYSTCHWCHVMERESFEDERIAAIMNRDFVCVKLDREERPEVDRLYMTAVQALTGQGGWPLNVFLTPDLKPFFGGTYFPPDSRWGRPGFAEVLEQVAAAWKTQSDKIELSGEQLREALETFTRLGGDGTPASAVSFEGALEEFASVYDASWGGFGPAPKFPMPVNLNLLVRLHRSLGDRRALDMSVETLKAMAAGGIYDHVGGGFHRYSTDDQWHVPHFEKMLYDNAQLAASYVEAWQLAKHERFATVARETLDYLLRELGHPEGGFCSAEDADSLPSSGRNGHKAEGAFYVWTKDEILAVAGPEDGELFCLRYGVRPGGNVLLDPQNEFASRNVLYLDLETEEAARERRLAPEAAAAALERTRRRLFEARRRRDRPGLDDKVLVSWNGLAIGALAKAGAALDEPLFVAAARRAAGFIEARLWDPARRRLARRWRDGEALGPGIADDYAFLAQGLLDLFEADFDPRWLEWALALTEEALARFYDPARGGFYMTGPERDPSLIVRMKESQDNVEPAASSVAASNLLRLAAILGRGELRAAAAKTLDLFAEQMRESPRSLPQMLVALDRLRAEPRQLVVAGARGSPDTEALLRAARGRFLPHTAVLFADGGAGQDRLSRLIPALKAMRPVGAKAAAYVCAGFSCQAPVTDPERLVELL